MIVGTGALDGELKESIDKSGLSERVVFAGFRTDMDRCFAAFDIFVLPLWSSSRVSSVNRL